jgi:hypothetical protein
LERGDRIHPTEFSPFRASSRHLPSVALLERDIVDLCGDEGGSLETVKPGIPPGLTRGCFKNHTMRQRG